MAGSPPDIFLVTIDTLRADHVHCYGYQRIETPALDGLARDGIRFANAFTPSPITNSSHVSILTGLLPSIHGVTDFGIPLRPDHATAAQMLKARGYRTAAFIGSVVLDSNALAPGLDRGFDFYDNFPKSSKNPSRWGRLERRGMDVAARAEAWLDAHPGGPHFVWLHLYDPHDPYEPPPPFPQTYDGEVAYADRSLGHFVSHLKRRAIYRNAVIVVVGDHGEGLGDHGEDTHGVFLYDSTTHVPLILKLPAGNSAGRVIDMQVRTIDILPTLIELSGAQPVEGLDGQSLTAEAHGRIAFGETDYPSTFGWAPLRSVRADGFKFIEAPRPELYELSSDPGESRNRYEPWNDGVLNFRAMLGQMRARAPRTAPPKAAVGAETLAELKALGYLGRADVGSATNVPAPSLLPDPKDHIEEQNLVHRAMLEAEAGRPAAAREALQKLLLLDRDSFAALRQLGEMELAEGESAAAVQHLRHASELHPGDADTAFYLARAYEKTGDLNQARSALETSLKLRPGNIEARLLLGELYLASKQTAAAEDQFDAALLINPASLAAKLGRARVQIAGGRFEQAIRGLIELSESDRDDPALLELLSTAYRSIGNTAAANQTDARRTRLLKKR